MGGTTMVMAMVLPEQHCSLVDAYENCRALADAKVCCDYALHVGVTWWGAKVRNEGVRLRGRGGGATLISTTNSVLTVFLSPFLMERRRSPKPSDFWVKCVMT